MAVNIDIDEFVIDVGVTTISVDDIVAIDEIGSTDYDVYLRGYNDSSLAGKITIIEADYARADLLARWKSYKKNYVYV